MMMEFLVDGLVWLDTGLFSRHELYGLTLSSARRVQLGLFFHRHQIHFQFDPSHPGRQGDLQLCTWVVGRILHR